MNGVMIDIQYCDSIIRHADGLRYSLIGVYPNTCPISTSECVLAQMNFNISIGISAQRQDLTGIPLIIQIIKNGVPLTDFQLPPLPQAENNTFYGLIQQTVSHLLVADGDTLNARLLSPSGIQGEGNSLTFFIPEDMQAV